MIMIELTGNCKQVRLGPAADTLRGQHVQSALSEDEKGQYLPPPHPISCHSVNLVDILQDEGSERVGRCLAELVLVGVMTVMERTLSCHAVI